MYCTFADVKDRLRAELTRWDEDHVDDVIAAVSRRIDEETGRTFETGDAETRVYEAQRDGFCTIDDCATLTSVVWEDETVDSDEYSVRRNPRLLSVWALVNGSWDEGDEITVTGQFGYSATAPFDIWDVCVSWSARTLKQADAGLQDATAIPELGQLVYSAAIPADVRRTLQRYTRHSPVLRIS